MINSKNILIIYLTIGIIINPILVSNVISSEVRVKNKLSKEKSPYLQLHSENPVDWYPWGDEAFEAAKRHDKLIFLSIGYSTCHWCHVMEQESFMDKEVAALLNDSYISIKVDREERPDIDNFYMTICQMLTGSGGWPMTIIMTPDKKPFFAGTYFPKNTRFGRIGLMDLLPRLNLLWKNNRQKLIDAGDDNISSLKAVLQQNTAGDKIDKSLMDNTFSQLTAHYDQVHGGFGNAPKFPNPSYLFFLLRYWISSGDISALTMVGSTLSAIRLGGIYDQIGFGIHRYSTDADWLIPHFEKMLYDQALISILYTEMYLATGNIEYKETLEQIFTFIKRDMTSPLGAFYSAIDADSEGSEGKFYLWSEGEIRKALSNNDASFALQIFNISKDGNYQEAGRNTGKNILYLKKSISELSKELNIPRQQLNDDISRIVKDLERVRDKRIKPFKDEKILTDWNGLMIASFAFAGASFNNKQYIEQAQRAADFILTKMVTSDGRLMHRYIDGEGAISANCDDYAFFIWGLIELYEATFKIEYLKAALRLNDVFISHLWDAKNGGFYFTSDDDGHGNDVIRTKQLYDGAVPSGNSVAAFNLLRLGRITGDTNLETMVDQIGMITKRQALESPAQYSFLLSVFVQTLGTFYDIVIVGDPDKDDTKEMIQALRSHYIPNKVVIFKDRDSNHEITEIAKFSKGQTEKHGKATAYICVNKSCLPPTTDISAMLGMLKPQKP